MLNNVFPFFCLKNYSYICVTKTLTMIQTKFNTVLDLSKLTIKQKLMLYDEIKGISIVKFTPNMPYLTCTMLISGGIRYFNSYLQSSDEVLEFEAFMSLHFKDEDDGININRTENNEGADMSVLQE